ncbi:class I SAM-dependent methyltransferase [Rhodococcus chondri]|uniref:Class I SAM-dependent methyltransferase n=1 Tax=Rhodococcus chondri TaxID=3065941 RepID=A0ABU7JX02_9NOCA|nr:class I SAM-dependent methyltransferase [Rhodococcus sp. CC-R104]MEE2034558.1 class I SAM-dependent methyltransferase [Rhodococcus sp. CC-R104]
MSSHEPASGIPSEPAPDDRHATANTLLGTSTVGRMRLGSVESERASRSWWDADAEDYHRTHGEFLGVDSAEGDFVWCPEGLHEGDVRLLGDVAGKDVLEIGCGSAPCARWLAGQGARPVGLDISMGMLARGTAAMDRGGERVPLVQAGAEDLPFRDGSFDVVCSAFGAVPFVADSARVMSEAARVLRPGGLWVFAVNHPMRWIFPDDPGEKGLLAMFPYFDRTPYVELDDDGTATYVEHHRTVGDRVRELVGAGLEVYDIVEPEWPEWLDREWGQWSPLRGQIFPGTAIFCSRKPV